MEDSERAKFKLELYVDDDGTPVVRNWLRGLSLTKRKVLGMALKVMLQELGIDVCGTEFGRQLGKGLFEFRLRQKPGDVLNTAKKKLPPEHVLLRVFCHAYGDCIVLLLGGYDKGGDPTKKRQAKEIALARLRLERWKARRF